jgi:hypothetical protein
MRILGVEEIKELSRRAQNISFKEKVALNADEGTAGVQPKRGGRAPVSTWVLPKWP